MSGLRKLALFLVGDPLQKGIKEHVNKLAEMRMRWDRCVESPLRNHATPANYANGCLFVHTQSSAWASHLRHHERDLVSRLREDTYFKDLTRLKVRIKPNRYPSSARI